MDKRTQAVSDAMGTIAEDAHALMAATADVAGEKVSDARKRRAAALESGREIYGRVKEKAGSLLQTILKSAGRISNLWLAFRSPGHDPKDK